MEANERGVTDMKRPFEVDSSEYPFKDHWMPYRDGHIHYIDEGHGPTVLLLHGNPTWSYLYQTSLKSCEAIIGLVAMDYPGLGMSRRLRVTGIRRKSTRRQSRISSIVWT